MSKGLGILAAAAFVFTALAYPVAFAIAGTATEAYLIAGKDPTAVAVEQELFEPPKGASKDSKEYRDAVLRIYGVPTDEPTKVVFWPAEKFVHPKQLPTLTILPVYKEKGENPLQVKTVWFFASRATLGAAITGVILTVLSRLTRKKQQAPPAPPPAA